MVVFKVPRIFIANNVSSFLDEFTAIFQMKNKKEPNVVFDLSGMDKIDLLGLLLIYKMIEFVVKNRCCISPKIIADEFIENRLKEYGFWDLLDDYINKKKADYDSLNFLIKGRFFIAPMALLREQRYSEEDVMKNFLPQIERYYSHVPKASSMILQCLSEVLLNFWEHAIGDTKSILIAVGNKDSVEIACADTGQGILSTLGPTLNDSLSKEDVLKKSLQMGVTSKQGTNHMGCGLWILNEIVTLSKGRLQLYSEGAYYINEYGHISSGTCSYWKGTIIYLFLSLSSPKSLSDIKDFDDLEFNDINVNIV